MDVFDFLDQVKQRPGMYVGSTDDRRGDQLRNLELLLHGYAIALGFYEIHERVVDFPREFASYLHDRFGWSPACGAVAAICRAAGSDEESWEMFWRLVAEFRDSRLSPESAEGHV